MDQQQTQYMRYVGMINERNEALDEAREPRGKLTAIPLGAIRGLWAAAMTLDIMIVEGADEKLTTDIAAVAQWLDGIDG